MTSRSRRNLSCHQAAEQELLVEDREIEELKTKLACSSRGSPTPPSHSDLDNDPPLVPPAWRFTLSRRMNLVEVVVKPRPSISTQGKTLKFALKLSTRPAKSGMLEQVDR